MQIIRAAGFEGQDMSTRIGVDIGGTFTDLVWYDDQTGETAEGKVPTVPHAPDEGVIEVVRRFVPPEVINRAEYFLHGTTVGLNALLERRGATVGMINTRGFRDVLEIRRGDRAEMYNLFWNQPAPLVPRRLRLEVDERTLADGRVLRPLDASGLPAILARFADARVDAIAVAFLNAYANPANELAMEVALREAGFEGGVSLSHRVSGEYREYERFSTTAIDAFVRQRMSHYLSRLEAGLRGLGFRGQCLITRSGAGSMTFSEAEERPFETIMSGPVGGAQGGTELARALGLAGLITADVGGTSFDTALVLDGEVKVLFEGEVAGMPVQTPWVDVRSIGAGGGSIAHVDIGGLMRVGPRSAGAVPGPVCYGKGGTEPTTTDAAGHLGMLGPGLLASGIQLDFAGAQAALARVGGQIGQDADGTAVGILRIAAAAMANAMREVTVEQGLDPRGMTLLPFGGAGPMFATLLADELQVRSIVVPPLAGNFSAWGLLGADMRQTAARTRIMPLDDAGVAEANVILAELFATLDARGETSAPTLRRTARIDLRYVGQEHGPSIPVPVEGRALASNAAGIRRLFDEDYLRSFGSTMEFPVEIVAVRATNEVPLPRRAQRLRPVEPRPETTWRAWSFETSAWHTFRVIDRGAIADALDGPSIVTESTATLYVDVGWTARPGASGELVLTRRETRA
jgi:N-methylhydantoinase A